MILCFQRLLVVMLVSLSLLSCSQFEQEPYVVISNGTVIDVQTGDKTLSDILIVGERIQRIVPNGTLEEALRRSSKTLRVIDATGHYIIPGLWDMHVHMNYILEASDNWMSPFFIAYGVTNVRDMGGELDNLLALQELLKQPDVVAPRLWMAGPLIDGSPQVFDGKALMSAFPTMTKMPVNTPEEAIALVDRLVDSGIHFIKPYEMLRPEVFAAMAKQAHYHGLLVDGHVPQRMTVLEALNAGMDGIAHMKGIDYGCSNDPEALRDERVSLLENMDKKESGLDLWTRVRAISVPKAMEHQNLDRCNALIQLFVERGTWHTPGLSTEEFLSTLLEKVSDVNYLLQYMPPAVQAEKKTQFEILTDPASEHANTVKIMVDKYDWKKRLIKKMHNSGVKLLAGTDTPALLLPGSSLHDELEVLVQAGLSPLAALQTATINPARFFNVDKKQGAIGTGMIADLILLKEDPLIDIKNTRAIHAVIVRGRVQTRTELDKLLGHHTPQ